MKKPDTMQYVILKPRQKINLNLFESEKYEPAIIVQQLVGTLIYYSNFGRYESRLAEKWVRVDEKKWQFFIKNNLKAENGEVINAESFKRSIERSLFTYSKKGGVPILNLLEGYDEFVENNKTVKDISLLKPIRGITADGLALTFTFKEKVKSGFLQILSFSPFGYISADNFTSDGEWKDERKFISSGPYVISEIKIGDVYKLKKNKYWENYEKSAPNEVLIFHDVNKIDYSQPVLVDAFTHEYSDGKLSEYKLVPEYINSVLVGNLTAGIFKDKKIRQNFKKHFDLESEKLLPKNFGVNIRSSTFYPNQLQSAVHSVPEVLAEYKNAYVNIEGDIPVFGTARGYAWQVLEAVLTKLGIKYRFAKNEASFSEITSNKYDLRIRGSSIGGGVEAWGLFVSFCSSVGIKFPDPNGVVCKLIEDYESNKIDEKILTSEFLLNVEDEAAILPVSHYGIKLLISEEIDTDSFSPLLAILKFDQMRLKHE